ncbi:MAG: hypothetical protein R2932_47650 [Caldilineaceae bacterium]
MKRKDWRCHVLRKRRPVYRLAGKGGSALWTGASKGYDVPPFVIVGRSTDPTARLWERTFGHSAPGARGL